MTDSRQPQFVGRANTICYCELAENTVWFATRDEHQIRYLPQLSLDVDLRGRFAVLLAKAGLGSWSLSLVQSIAGLAAVLMLQRLRIGYGQTPCQQRPVGKTRLRFCVSLCWLDVRSEALLSPLAHSLGGL